MKQILPIAHKKLELPYMIKNQQKTEIQDQIPPCSQDQRFLDIRNYGFLASQSAHNYRKCLKLLSEAFVIDFKGFQDKNPENQSESQAESPEIILECQNLDEILCHNEKVDFMKSYGGFTRKSNKILFLLVFRCKSNGNNSVSNEGLLKFLFLNDEGRIIHVMSNLATASSQKLAKVIEKFFRNLEHFFVVDISPNPEDSSLIIQELYSKKITKALIYISPKNLELMELPERIDKFPLSDVQCLNTLNLQNDDSNLMGFILRNKGHQVQELEINIKKALRFQKIHNFILESAFRPLLLSKISQKMLFTNQWLNNTIAWYFNVVQSLGENLQIEKNTKQALETINSKIATLFSSKIQSKQISDQKYKFRTSKCFPSLLSTTKFCIVCRERKPKYGCQKCSKKYNISVNLCVEECFKNFHKNRIKYLSKKFVTTSESSNADKQLTSIAQTGVFEGQSQGKAKKIRQSNSHVRHLRVEKDCKCHTLQEKYKIIRKKVKRIQKEDRQEIKLMKYRGVGLFNFRAMEVINEDLFAILEKPKENPSEKMQDSQNSSKIKEEGPLFSGS